jgi:hypothetical protein
MLIIRTLGPLLLCARLIAADAPTPTEEQVSARFAAKDYAGAETGCRALQAKHPDDAEIAYALACAIALQNRTDDALAALARARELGYGDAPYAEADPSLGALHGRPEFQAVLAEMRKLPIGSGARREPGAEIAGVRAIENHPKGGLRYRLRLGDAATAAAPHRLVVWLHPSGGSVDQQVEPLSVDLAKRGWALAVFPQKHYVGWSDEERDALAPTIADLATVPGVDARHPVLMGFSAGGKVAITLWKREPGAWGGLLLDAAYPVDLVPGTHNGTIIALTPEMLAAKTPMLALIGEQDVNLPTWQIALPIWTKAGLPVELRTVAGRGHEFLFTGADWTVVLAWLEHLPKADPAKPTSR